jgi:DNA mismatch endonuclease (patch repair protein)
MARVRNRDTEPETALRRALWHLGLRFRVRSNLPGTPDLVFVGAKIAVFVDGCFWHGCPNHYTEPVRNAEFWRSKLLRNLERDRRVNEELDRLGWLVVRIWEHELTQDMDLTVQRLKGAVLERRGDQRPRS